MKKVFITLSFLFAIIYANNDMSGYTESIVESFEPNNFNSNLKPQRGAILPYSKEYLYTEELPHNPYSGEIVEFDWKGIIPDIIESKDHPNGFDGLTSECYGKKKSARCLDPEDEEIPIVNISIELGKTASFIIKKDGSEQNISKPYNALCLLQEKKYIEESEKKVLKNIYSSKLNILNKITTDGIDITDSKPKTCNKKNSSIKVNSIDGSNDKKISIDVKKFEDGGIYTLYLKNTKTKRGTWNDIIRINIIPYREIIKNFLYVQLDGNGRGWNPLTDPNSNSFTETDVVNQLNKTYKQAVIKVNPTTKLYGVTLTENKLVEVDLTRPEKNTWEEKLVTRANNYFYDYIDREKDRINSALWRTVFVINKERKKWVLSACKENNSNTIELTYCNKFNPEYEPTSIQYFLISPDEECVKKGGVGTTPKPVEIRLETTSKDGEIEKHYYPFFEDRNPAPLVSCDILYTDNGIPIPPGKNGLNGAAAINVPFPDDMFDNYLPQRSVMIIPRGIGEDGYNTLSHEFGHSLGLTDVESNITEIQNKTENAIYNEQESSSSTLLYSSSSSLYTYDNTYATKERNLMSFMQPIGNKLRYRDMPIKCTGLKKTILKIKKDNDGNLCKEGETCQKKEIIIDQQSKELPSNVGAGDNQWECARNCFLILDDFSYDNRKAFFNSSGILLSEALEDEEKYRFAQDGCNNLILDIEEDKKAFDLIDKDNKEQKDLRKQQLAYVYFFKLGQEEARKLFKLYFPDDTFFENYELKK